MNASASNPGGPPKGPLVMLALLTVATMVGPFVIFLAIRGGDRPDWPPDRPLEWWIFGLTVGGFLVLFLGCLSVGFRARAKSGS